MAWLPEVAVQSTFLSAGLHFGYLLHQPFKQEPDGLQGWPLLVAVASAAATAALLYILKRKSKREMFRQPLLLAIGVIFLELGGVTFFYPEYAIDRLGVYLSSIGHGIIYVSALSFLNNRVSSRCRSSRIAMGHLWYQLGCAIASQLLEQPHGWKRDFATAMSFITGVNIILLLTNELFQYFKVYDYKCSLDDTLNAVNKQNLLLLNRKEIIDTLRANYAEFPEGYTLLVTEVKLRWKLTVLLLFLKVQAFMAFALPMKFIFLGRAYDLYFFLMIEWLKLIGVIVFVLMGIFISARKLHLVFNSIQMVALVVALCLVNDLSSDFRVPVLMFYAFIGVIYPVCDIAVMDTSKFSLTEVNIFIGFAIEKLLVSVFVFAYFYDPMIIFYDDVSATFYAYGSAFIIYSAAMLFLVYFIYCNTHGMSLYTVRKEMLGIHMVKRADEQPIAIIPPVNFNFPGDKRREVLMRNLSRSPGASASTSTAPVFVGGMNNRYDADLRRMTPAAVLPRAIIGGAIMSSFAFNM